MENNNSYYREFSIYFGYIPEQETFLGQLQKQEHSRFMYMDKVQDVCWCAEISYTQVHSCSRISTKQNSYPELLYVVKFPL